MGRSPRILLVTPLRHIRQQPRNGGMPRSSLILRHLESLGEVEIFRPRPWQDHARPGYYETTREMNDASLAAVLCGSLASHLPGGAGPQAYADLEPSRFDVIFLLGLACTWWD